MGYICMSWKLYRDCGAGTRRLTLEFPGRERDFFGLTSQWLRILGIVILVHMGRCMFGDLFIFIQGRNID